MCSSNLHHRVVVAVLTSFIVWIFSGCGTTPFCNAVDKQEGIIIDLVNFDRFCDPKINATEFIVNSDSSYFSVFDSLCTKPAIDFSQETMLGFYLSGGGCDIGFERSVSRDDNNQCYVYRVKVRECGKCKMMGMSYNWVRVPKLPVGWTVKFIRQ